MYQILLPVLAVLGAAMAEEIDSSLHARWAVFKHQYNKVYSPMEEVVRLRIYRDNLRTIAQHNELFAAGESSYYLGENHLADMTAREVAGKMNGLRMRPRSALTYARTETVDTSLLPASVDWRKEGYVTPVKDQGECGSCWAFSTTGSLEGQHFKATGKLVSLSESNLVDCSQSQGNMGCEGGLMDYAFKYVIHNGIDTEASYPYQPVDAPCAFSPKNVGSTEKGYKDLPTGDEKALQKAVATIGPISVGINASLDSFQLYKGGVYDPQDCGNTELDHGVLVAGYGTDTNGMDFWLVKNSWSDTWGEEGYIRMARNHNNNCGVATQPSYPIV